jgi:hypothetical protein
MKNKLEQLAGNALDKVVPYTWTTLDYEEIHKILAYHAELVVRECGVALSPMLRDMISRGQAYDLIKEHFGVEE